MPLGLGHFFFAIWALILFGGILVVIVLVVRAILQGAGQLARCADSLEAIQKTLVELENSVEALERRLGEKQIPK